MPQGGWEEEQAFLPLITPRPVTRETEAERSLVQGLLAL